MVGARTWAKFQKANYATERLLHADRVTTIRALAAQWDVVKPPTKTQRLASKRAAAPRPRRPAPRPASAPISTAKASTQTQTQTPGPTPPPQAPAPGSAPPARVARGLDASDIELIASPYNFAVLSTGEHRPDGTAISQWRGGWKLKEDKVVLWINFNDNHTVLERRVIKTVEVERALWLDPTVWAGDVKDYNTRLPMDYVLQRRLCTAADGAEFFNRVRACVVNNANWTYKLIFDYADQEHAGDLPRRYRDEDDQNNVPESLVWSILEDMVKAVLVMQQGAVSTQEEGWKEIIHRDFKPDNVFLTTKPNSIYPRAQLSDFEHSIEITQDDPFNPKVWREDGAGHSGYWAPEIRIPEQRAAIIKNYPDMGFALPENLREDLSADKISTAVNVYNIGTTMFSLMNGVSEQSFPGTSFEGWPSAFRCKRDDIWWNGWDDVVKEYYTDFLLKLVQSCLRDDPNERPTPQELLKLIQDDSGNRKADRRKGARGGKTEDVEEFETEVLFEYLPAGERYRIGMAYADLLPAAQEEESDELFGGS